jgi:hypothetical protein
LWNETNPEARKKKAQNRAKAAIRGVEQIMLGEEYVELSDDEETIEARQNLLEACQAMLKAMKKHNMQEEIVKETSALESKKEKEETPSEVMATSDKKVETKKKSRSVLFGAAMGAIVACWVYSGNWIFTGVFTLMTILGQLEYYRMVMNTGIYPARRISVIGACSMFLTVSYLTSLVF